MKNNQGFTPRNKSQHSQGFTYIELALVMAISIIVFGLSAGAIRGIQQKASLNTSIDSMMTDLREQQIKAMAGETEGRSTHDSYGLHLQSGNYIFFHGPTYSSSDPYNFTTQLIGGMQLTSIMFPSSRIIFASGSGEITNFSSGNNTFIMRNTTTGEQKTVTINRYGTISSIQ